MNNLFVLIGTRKNIISRSISLKNATKYYLTIVKPIGTQQNITLQVRNARSRATKLVLDYFGIVTLPFSRKILVRWGITY